MKCILILDALGPHPDLKRLNRAGRRAAPMPDDAPRTVVNPAGFVGPDHPAAWVHCFPMSGLHINPKTGLPVRGKDGPVLAEPFDAACRAAVARRLVGWGRARGMNPDQARAALDKLVAASKALQLKNSSATAP